MSEKRLYLSEAVAFSLPEKELQLMKLELSEGSDKELPFGIIVDIDAIHNGPTKNFTWYTEKFFKNSLPTWTTPFPKPVLQDHIVAGFDSGIDAKGRVIGARIEKIEGEALADGSKPVVLKLAAFIPEYDDIQKIVDGRYQTVSIGSSASKVTCSICGSNLVEDYCGHFRGRVYEKELDGKTKKEVCYWIVEAGEASEVSFVNNPADKNAIITGVRTKLSKNEMLPSKISALSELYLVSGEEIISLNDGEPDRILSLAEVWQKASAGSSTKENDLDNESQMLTVEELEELSLESEVEESEGSTSEESTETTDEASEALEEATGEEQKDEEIASAESLLDALEDTSSTEEETSTEESEEVETTEEEASEMPDLQEQISTLESQLEEAVTSKEALKDELESRLNEKDEKLSALEEQNVRLRSALSKMLAEHLVDIELAYGLTSSTEYDEKLSEYFVRVANSPSEVFTKISETRMSILSELNKRVENEVLATEESDNGNSLPPVEDILIAGLRERKAGIRIKK